MRYVTIVDVRRLKVKGCAVYGVNLCDWLNGDPLINCYWTDKQSSKINLLYSHKDNPARKRNCEQSRAATACLGLHGLF